MKRWLFFSATFLLLLLGLVLSQTRKINAAVGPDALLYLLADTQRDLTVLPMAYTRISDAEEIRIGNRIARLQETDLSDEDRLIQNYVQAVGARVAANAHRKLPYRFHYIPQRYFVNAFALPGGHVYIGAGLLELMDNEDELAAVLGHEIEHIDHYHCAERLQVEAALRKVPLGELVEIPVELFQMGYSKDQELEADREGTRLAVKAGYSAEGAVDIFAQFQKMEEQMQGKPSGPVEEMSGAAIQVLTGYFRSHPESSDRVAQIRSLIAQEGWPQTATRPLQVRYIFLAYKAQDQVNAAHYDKAVKTATHSLSLHPGYPPALVALAKAKIALHDFAAATAAYKDLLSAYPADADAVRAFAGALSSKAMAEKKFSEAAQLVSFALELQPDNPDALRLLALVDLELVDVNAALQTGQKLRKLYPWMGTELVQYVNSKAEQAFAARNYERAMRFSSFSLQLQPLQPALQRQLARAEFALADFRAAANVYRGMIEDKLSDNGMLDAEAVRAYADSLGSLADHREAAGEFDRVLKPGSIGNDDFAAQVKIEAAGLWVMAGDPTKAHALTNPALPAEAFAPEHMARLGWWYYRAGKLDAAEQLLRRYLQQRPGSAGLQQTLAWVLIEKNMPRDALRLFAPERRSYRMNATVWAGESIARWRLRESEPAMTAFEQLARSAPEWTNPQWVKTLYGPLATQTIVELTTEQQRRMAARRIGAPPR
ncbi:MAG TPA: M48 family metalloprotease [Candidatus Angelobacter sp.]|nr:M48 family metalloprotease [Candidatus Angelobacter sp.]